MRRVLLAAALLALAASTAGAAPQRARARLRRGRRGPFNAADGTKLVGHRFGKGPKAVILGHQSQGNLCDWVPYAKRLARTATRRSRSTSVATASPTARGGAVPLALDLAAAAKALRKLGKKKVFLVGASMGGIAPSSPART